MKLTNIGALLALAVPRSAALEDLAIIPDCPSQSPDDRSCTMTEVPIIDISPLMQPIAEHGSARWNDTAEAVATACEEWGFFHVRLLSSTAIFLFRRRLHSCTVVPFTGCKLLSSIQARWSAVEPGPLREEGLHFN